MPVEIFSKQQFEDSLPKLKGTDKPAWKCAGLVHGEWVYLIPLGDKKIAHLLVRSSVDSTGWSRATGEDSLRVYAVDKDLKPLSGKDGRWTTRQPGWQDRLMKVIRFMAEMAVKIGTCPKCNEQNLRLLKVKKDGPNKGRWFLSCPTNNCHFEWLKQEQDEEKDSLVKCPFCDKATTNKFQVKKEGKNKGRWFVKCSDETCKYFEWVEA